MMTIDAASTLFLLLTTRRSPQSTLFPYTTLFRSVERASEHDGFAVLIHPLVQILPGAERATDRKSTRLNSSHQSLYDVFCLKKKISRIIAFRLYALPAHVGPGHLSLRHSALCPSR